VRTPWWLWTTIAGILMAIGVYGSSTAHADPVSVYTVTAAPVVCEVLDTYPTIAGVEGVLDGVKADTGFTTYQAAGVVVNAVYSSCPRHIALLQAFANTAQDAVTA